MLKYSIYYVKIFFHQYKIFYIDKKIFYCVYYKIKFMNVKKWGPGGWIFLHTISFNYPMKAEQKDKKRYTNHIKNTGKNLPCIYCRQSFDIYTKYLKIEPFLNDRHGVTYHLYRLHDLVNKKLFVESPPFVDIVRQYEAIRAKCSKMIKDGYKDKKINTCQKKVDSDEEIIQEFAKIAIKKYKKIADDMIKQLYKDKNNPNKDCIKYYDKLKKNSKKNKQLKEKSKLDTYAINYEHCDTLVKA